MDISDFKPLKLIAQSRDDLPWLSTVLQDAVCNIGDLSYLISARQFTFAVNRYCWEYPVDKKGWRVRSGLQIGSVIGVQSRNIKRGNQEAILNLLSLEYEALNEPGGEIVFRFSGGGALRLTVECLDIVLADILEPWRAVGRPQHDHLPDQGLIDE